MHQAGCQEFTPDGQPVIETGLLHGYTGIDSEPTGWLFELSLDMGCRTVALWGYLSLSTLSRQLESRSLWMILVV